MNVSSFMAFIGVKCEAFPCSDVVTGNYIVPGIRLDPLRVRAVMVSEALPPDVNDYYYAEGDPLFQRTTVQAFRDAGVDAGSIGELLGMGFYFTTAVKCGKTGYGVKSGTVKECSLLLERELDAFPNLKVLLLMGDVAIKALNYISKRKTGRNVVPPGSTYKIRGSQYFYGDIRVFPSYLQAGPSFFIEQSKRRMIAEDIREAMKILGA
jgi:hypothetical protein